MLFRSIGFDYNAAVEWYKRLHEIETFKVRPNESFLDAVKKAIMKYHASYIVFLRYASPSENGNLELIYTNKDFKLFKVTR